MKEKFIKPDYQSYCFSNIPGTVQSLLGAREGNSLPESVLPEGEYKEYQKVVFIFVDAFGWKFFEKYKDKYPALQRFVEKGKVSKLTAQFPSTTAAEVTTMNTGLTIGESGVYEWFYYEPKLDAVIAPLLFSYAKDGKRGTLGPTGIDATELFPTHTLYQELNKHKIKSKIFLSVDYATSEYNSVVSKGADIVPFRTLSEGFTNLSNAIVAEKGKSYFYFYYGGIDSIGHDYGSDSRFFESEIDVFFSSLENIFLKYIEGKVNNAIVLLSADHGQTDVDPLTTFYLNLEIEGIDQYFQKSKNGQLIVPEGSCRDMFLHIKPEKLNDLKNILSERLAGKAEIYLTEELIKNGYFGKNISPEFKSKVGNLVILPYAGESVWWYERDVFEQKHIGHHGGLTPEEMEIPFLALSF